jgi:hypothetical protein
MFFPLLQLPSFPFFYCPAAFSIYNCDTISIYMISFLSLLPGSPLLLNLLQLHVDPLEAPALPEGG